MPLRHPCPQCPEFFMSDQVLETHIHFVHSNGASQPPRANPLVRPVPVVHDSDEEEGNIQSSSRVAIRRSRRLRPLGSGSASAVATRVERSGTDDEPRGQDRMSASRRDGELSAQPGLGDGRRTNTRSTDQGPSGIEQPSLSVDGSTNPSSGSRHEFMTPLNIDTMGSITADRGTRQAKRPDQPLWRPRAREQRRSASPTRGELPLGTPVRNFATVYESREVRVHQRLEIPTNTPWVNFTALMEAVSAPVAGAYIPGRTTGFTLADGAWRYALVDREGVRDDRWRPLTSNLCYQAMISELMARSVIWRHALLRHDTQTSSSNQL
ncbi:hypothetical protein MMC16_001992 [Acarospora aff. strigata]|nr:hypothetical protein [Acarospora aff. strigata]